MASAFLINALITPILSETFEPQDDDERQAGFANSCSNIDFLSSTAPSPSGKQISIPAVEAWARCCSTGVFM
jgi:hypothetical protein